MRRSLANDLRVGRLAYRQHDFRRIEIGQSPAEPRIRLGRVGRGHVAGVEAPFGGGLYFSQHRNIGALRLHQGLIGEHVHVGGHGIQQHALADISERLPPRFYLILRDTDAVGGLVAIVQNLADRYPDGPRAQCCALYGIVGQ